MEPARLLCWWDSLGKNTGVGSRSLSQGIFPTQGPNQGLLHCRRILYQLSHQGSPKWAVNKDSYWNTQRRLASRSSLRDPSADGMQRPSQRPLVIPNQAQLHHPPLPTKGHQPAFLVVTSGVTTEATGWRPATPPTPHRAQDSPAAWN